MTEYTPEFWKRAIELQMQPDKCCEKCKMANGWIPTDPIGRPLKKHIPLRVVVGLRTGDKAFVSNLGLFCTRCRKGKYQVKMKKADLDKLILPLFE